MKKKNVLALALAAGLVFGGTAYADGEAEQAPAPAPAQTTEELQVDKEVVPQPVEAPAPNDASTPEKPVEENNENGYSSEAAADAAGKAAAAASKKYYEVYLQYGNYHYRLLDAPSKEQEIKDNIYKQQPKKLAEDKFNPDQGYATFEEAQKQQKLSLLNQKSTKDIILLKVKMENIISN